MQTFSHFIITAAVGKTLDLKNRSSITGCLIGSVLPDVPLMLLTAYTYLTTSTLTETHLVMHNNYATNPLWIASHNIFHSFIVLGLIAIFAFSLYRTKIGKLLLWLAIAASLHTVIDIFTHHSDGPYFLFPLSWTIRFESPVSYWDTAYYGGVFRIFEYGLDIGLLVLMSRPFLMSYLEKNEGVFNVN